MPHFTVIGRKTLRARLAYLLMYILLTLGGITMIVPFLVMISTSFKSSVDGTRYAELVPGYWTNDRTLALKYVEQETNYDLNFFNDVARMNAAKMADVELPPAVNASAVQDYTKFVATLPVNFTVLGNRGAQFGNPGTYGLHPAVREYRTTLLKKYGTLQAIRKEYAMELATIDELAPPIENWHTRAYQPTVDTRMQDFLAFKAQQPVTRRIPVPAESVWSRYLRVKYGTNVQVVNTALGTRYTSIEAASMPARVPAGPAALRAAWEECVRNDMPIWFVRVDPSARSAWGQFLKARYLGDLALYRKAHQGTAINNIAAVPMPTETPLNDNVAMGEWSDFVMTAAPLGALRLDTPEQRYRTYLLKTYGNIAGINAAYGTQYASMADIYLPTIPVKVAECQTNAGSIRWAFITRNYQTVSSYLVLHGRAFFNTTIYILLALLFTLTINPITAYALSRFKLSATNKILLFLLATMAFPAEIAMIPNFLILKELHLLNSYWALVLPGMANGFSIFLLKGMFDGLPQDLYEAASLDGAGEATIFWRITMPLVKPFLAYLALGTFVSAYSAFAFAFLLCPDPKMWTVMVFLQQMSWASEPVKFAAFVLASIPTLVVFVTCQRIIMQGIVLPTEK